MCGIAGFNEDSTIDDPDYLMRQMLSCLERRGPDGRGQTEVNCPGRKWYLGHHRLAIIDIEGGNQPMSNQERTIAVSCNGEIYNFQSLKKELAGLGHDFKTRSDTEVLIHGYEQWGMENLLSRLQGMFAFALIDREKDKVFLARDPTGQKPLYYAHSASHGLAFASSPDPILRCPWVSHEIDYQALKIGLALRHIPSPFTAYKMIRKLSPGSYICLEKDVLSIRRYWNYQSPGEKEPITLEQSAKGVFERLIRSVEECLVSDVPVCLMLSSGLDSSLVARTIAELGRASEILAVTVGFIERSYDESDVAASVARKLGFKHEVVLLEENHLDSALSTCLEMQEEPFSDPSLLPTLVLSETIRKYAKAALGGDGGDEIFGGYPTFTAIGLHNKINRYPVKGTLSMLSRLLPVSNKRYNLRYKAERFIRGLGLGQQQAFTAWLFTAEQNDLARVIRDGDEGYFHTAISELAGDFEESDEVRLMSLLYLKLFLPGVLNKVDMASMHFGLEVRAPMLQPQMIRYALDLPGSVKVRKRRTKAVLRRLAADLGLADTSRILKRGFNVPLSQWITGKIRPTAEKYLNRDSLEKSGFFDTEFVLDLWNRHLAGKRDNFDLLWCVLNTQRFLLDKC